MSQNMFLTLHINLFCCCFLSNSIYLPVKVPVERDPHPSVQVSHCGPGSPIFLNPAGHYEME